MYVCASEIRMLSKRHVSSGSSSSLGESFTRVRLYGFHVARFSMLITVIANNRASIKMSDIVYTLANCNVTYETCVRSLRNVMEYLNI